MSRNLVLEILLDEYKNWIKNGLYHYTQTANFIGDIKTTNPKNVSSEIAKLLKSYNW